jgi:hypothetical protein
MQKKEAENAKKEAENASQQLEMQKNSPGVFANADEC